MEPYEEEEEGELEQIAFHSENLADFELADGERLRQWIEQTIAEEEGELGDINFIFCDDAYLHQINMQYLQHDDYTDVITFPYSEEVVEGDIFISVPRTQENAAIYGVAATDELHRVMIHGVLHLLGYGDKTPEEKAAMTDKENKYLRLLAAGK